MGGDIMRLPSPRGPLSTRVIAMLAEGRPAVTELVEDACAATDPDAQLTVWTLYELAYRGFDGVPDELEWDPDLVRLRGRLESTFEAEVRRATRGLMDSVRDVPD